MNRDKQIEELSKDIFEHCNAGLFEDEAKEIARFVIEEQGYRKASEVAREIIDEIFKILDAEYRNYDTEALSDVLNKMYMSSRNTVIKITAELVELKKKYTGSEKDDV